METNKLVSVLFPQHTLVLQAAVRVVRSRFLCQVHCSRANPCWNIRFSSSLQGHPWPRCQTCNRCHPDSHFTLKSSSKRNSTEFPTIDSCKKQLVRPKQWTGEKKNNTMSCDIHLANGQCTQSLYQPNSNRKQYLPIFSDIRPHCFVSNIFPQERQVRERQETAGCSKQLSDRGKG